MGPDMKAKITKRVVGAVKASDRDQFIWDTETRGFGMKVTKLATGKNGKRTGGRKVYILQARFKGRVRRWRIGEHGSPWTPDKAREKAVQWLGWLVEGKDPALEEGSAQRDMTVSALADLYFREGCEHKKQSTTDIERGLTERHIKKLIGHRGIGSLTQTDVERLMADIAAGKTAGTFKTKERGKAIVKGGKPAANRTRAVLSAMCTFAKKRGMIPANPCADVQKYKEQGRERILTSAELARLGDALRNAEAKGENPSAIAAIRLLLLTGCRKSEILSLKWKHVDSERHRLVLEDSKTGARVVPVGRAVIKLLENVKRVDGTPYVFPASTGEGHYIGLPKIWRKVRKAAEMPELRLHDLRHHYASTGVMRGDPLLIIGRVLGHRQYSTTERYSHVHDDPMHQTADGIASEIERGLTKKKQKNTQETGEAPPRFNGTATP